MHVRNNSAQIIIRRKKMKGGHSTDLTTQIVGFFLYVKLRLSTIGFSHERSLSHERRLKTIEDVMFNTQNTRPEISIKHTISRIYNIIYPYTTKDIIKTLKARMTAYKVAINIQSIISFLKEMLCDEDKCLLNVIEITFWSKNISLFYNKAIKYPYLEYIKIKEILDTITQWTVDNRYLFFIEQISRIIYEISCIIRNRIDTLLNFNWLHKPIETTLEEIYIFNQASKTNQIYMAKCIEISEGVNKNRNNITHKNIADLKQLEQIVLAEQKSIMTMLLMVLYRAWCRR